MATEGTGAAATGAAATGTAGIGAATGGGTGDPFDPFGRVEAGAIGSGGRGRGPRLTAGASS